MQCNVMLTVIHSKNILQDGLTNDRWHRPITPTNKQAGQEGQDGSSSSSRGGRWRGWRRSGRFDVALEVRGEQNARKSDRGRHGEEQAHT